LGGGSLVYGTGLTATGSRGGGKLVSRESGERKVESEKKEMGKQFEGMRRKLEVIIEALDNPFRKEKKKSPRRKKEECGGID